ncbi:MAG: TPR domain-containing protein [Candidatus Puniceispirillaceae bacterium]|jgi:cytochrome c-type biogenesis protein CcmH
MSPVDSEMIVMFVMGGGFCLLLAGAMLAYIRAARRGLVGISDDADLRGEIDRLMLARTALDQDHQSGRIGETDYAATCLDIDRRLLALSQQTPDTPNTPGTGDTGDTRPALRQSGRLAIGLLLALPVGAAVIYASLGRPDLADNPLVNRTAEIASRTQMITATKQDLAQNLANAQAATVASPDDVESWLTLAEAAAAVNDSATEIRALRTARQLTNDDPAVLSLLAEALSRAADGQVTVPARALIDTVLATDPADPRALFLWGLSAFQDGAYADAISRWQTLLSISTPDAPWLPIVRRNIQQAAEAGDILLESENGPDADSLAAAADMSAQDRDAMILSMVEALRDRLRTTPDDTEGWQRLARAYGVLGDAEAAFDALARAAASAPQDHALTYQLLEKTIGVEMSAEQLRMAQTALDRLTADAAEAPQYLFFTGHLARLSGAPAKARTAWTKLLDSLPADSDMAATLAAEIAKLNQP